MLLDEARSESEALVEHGKRAVAEYHEHGNSQVYQDALIALTARIRAVPSEQAGLIIADLVGMLAWGGRRG
ncbi:MAG: hypothetical protein BGN97_04545 [Microbacterium sp. 69-10]|nr:MAG: hypothetical protein BGN97_04545 [Microbacterium sp. 69-10]